MVFKGISFFVTAIIPVTASGGRGRPGSGSTITTVTTTATTTVSITTTVGCATGLHPGTVCYQRRPRGCALRQCIDSGSATILWCSGTVGRVPRPSGAAGAATSATAEKAADAPAG